MKKLLIILMILTLGTFLACGNDEGDSGVSLEITTEDGVENFGSISPQEPNLNLPIEIDAWLEVLQVQAYANGKINNSNLIMSKIVNKSALIRGDFLVIDVPAGRDIIFLINAIDANKVIQYSGKVGPVSIRPRSIVPLSITLKRMINVPVSKDYPMSLRLLRSDGVNSFDIEIDRFGINSNASSPNIKVNMYTQAVYINDRWIPANPQNGFDYSISGNYNGTSDWTGSNFISSTFMLVTAHVEDNNKGLVFYGVRAYNSDWYSENPLRIYMQNPTRLAVRFNSYPGTATVRAKMVVNGSARQLYKYGTFTSDCGISIANPVAVFDAPSGQEWFGGSSSVQNRTVIITDTSDVEIYQVNTPVDWGGNVIEVP